MTTVAARPGHKPFADVVAGLPVPRTWGWMTSWRCLTCGLEGGITRGWTGGVDEGDWGPEEPDLSCGIPDHDIVTWLGPNSDTDPAAAVAHERRREREAHFDEGHRLLTDAAATDQQLVAGIVHLRYAAAITTPRESAADTSCDSTGHLDSVGEYRRLNYRALVLQSMHTELPPVWQAVDDDGTDLLALAIECGCVGPEQRPCRHWDLCLAAAIWLDTPDQWAAGVDRASRVECFAELERVAVGVDVWIAVQRPEDLA